MPLVPNLISGPAGRIGAAAQNALEVARFGGLETDEQPSPYAVVAESSIYKLRRYYPPGENGSEPTTGSRPPVVLVPPMMLAAEIYDVAPSTSAVSLLSDHGIDPWVVDFGAPEKVEGGLERSLTDHVLAVNEAIDRVREETGADPHIGGYSQGGMFCYQVASLRRSEGIASVIVFGSPVDTRGTMSFGLPEELISRGAEFLADHVLEGTALPAWASRTGFRLMDPAKSLRQRIDFVRKLHDREALLPKERQRRFLEGEGWVAWPGPALAEVVRQFGVHNRMLSGGFVIEDRLVTLADLTCPVLVFVGETDEIAPPRSVRAVVDAAPRAEIYEKTLKAGHFGLVVGGTAVNVTWPTVAGWAKWKAGQGELPDGVERRTSNDLPVERDRGFGDALGARIELAAGAGLGAAQALAGAAIGAGRTVRNLTSGTGNTLYRLNRLGRVGPRTRISLGSLLDEQRSRAPDDIALLFADRGITNEAVNERVDNVVRGLLEIGVRQGEHVGVLMQTRPSALTVVSALSRLGAVAVLMRPDSEIAREAELGKVRRIVADPPNGERAAEETGQKVFVLGGGGEERELAAGLYDMERIDPARVKVPAWYRANPGRAGDLAFILFTGSGANIRANRITNGRWALSAFGTASSAALTSSDTIYSATPVYHPSALLMSVGGAVAGGARLALASEFEPEIFWQEVRRYGATVVSYTWTMLDSIVEGPPDQAERHHPVRLFIGSGMPRGLWKRATHRFAPARVLEFYASTEGDAVLVNLTGEKAGCMGRPLPGSAEVRIAAWDADEGRLVEREDGFAQQCARREAGMLLVRVRSDAVTATGGGPLRGVFEPDDAWIETGDLFRRDSDGDFWLVDNAAAVIRTADGVVFGRAIVDALGDVDAVDLAVAYGVRSGSGGDEIAVAAITLREGESIVPAALTAALANRSDVSPPQIVRVVKEIPVTTWFRPLSGSLRRQGLPSPTKPVSSWYWDPEARGRGSYKPLTKAALSKLKQ